MAYIADLHLHSAYAYATSKALNLRNLSLWAKLKGIDLLATGDFTHPAWLSELQDNLAAEPSGLYSYNGVHFVLGTEVSCVFRQNGQGRRIHLLVFAPSLAVVRRLNRALGRYGNLESDGRPTLSLSVCALTDLVLDTSSDCIVIPAHAWTPWYGLYGSKSGFERLTDAFGDLSKYIYAVETGLSSDPEMNWATPELADKALVSFSDAHSLPKLAREATAFNGPLSYSGLVDALRFNQVAYTVEFYPEQGKYHYDGHRKCSISQNPALSEDQSNECPVCRRPLTLGVLNRIIQLSSNRLSSGKSPQPSLPAPNPNKDTPLPEGMVSAPDGRPPFIRAVPLAEIIAAFLRQGVNSKRVKAEYRRIVAELGNEMTVLLWADADALTKVAGPQLAQAILQARHGDIHIEPGYDGLYGKVSLNPPNADTGSPL